MDNKVSLQDLYKAIEIQRPRSAWDKGVKGYALYLIEHRDDLDQNAYIKTASELKEILLCGAENWAKFSWGGYALIYDTDIAKTLCAPWELRKTDNGRKPPNRSEQWLDTQARALYQAFVKLELAYINIAASRLLIF